jgi:hypothetical protein
MKSGRREVVVTADRRRSPPSASVQTRYGRCFAWKKRYWIHSLSDLDPELRSRGCTSSISVIVCSASEGTTASSPLTQVISGPVQENPREVCSQPYL